jgi:2-methylcitrate dehydratase PrpD
MVVQVYGRAMCATITSKIENEIVSLPTKIEYKDLPSSTKDRARRLLKDQIAVQIGTSDLPWSRNINRYGAEQERAGTSTIAADGRKVDSATAAFVNASYGHGFEYDDAHADSHSHPASIVVSASIAIGEAQEATIEEVLTAMITGYEVYTRIGTMAAPELLTTGWHPHPVLGPFGAAAATASLWNFDEQQTAHALAIAASHASGITEYSSTGGSVKRVHSGMGSRGGIEAARLAKHGVTGPRKFLTGNKGFFSTFVDKDGFSAADVGDLTSFEIDTAWIKPYCTCGGTHGYIDAVKAIDPDPANIDKIVARLQPETDSIVGTQNENAYKPTDIIEVQYSLPFQIALAAHGFGNGYQAHRRIVDGELIDNKDLLETVNKVEMVVDDELDTRNSSAVADVEIEFGDNSEHQFIEHSKGRAENPLTEEEFRAKIDDLTVPVLGEENAEQLAMALDSISLQDSVSELMELTYI